MRKKSSLKGLKHSSNSFISPDLNTPLNLDNSIDLYVSLLLQNGSIITHYFKDYSMLVIQLQLDFHRFDNNLLQVLIEIDRYPLKNREVGFFHSSLKFDEFYIVAFVNKVPTGVLRCNELVVLLNTIKVLMARTVKRYDYIVIGVNSSKADEKPNSPIINYPTLEP